MAVAMSSLKKVDFYATNSLLLRFSAKQKLVEFTSLGYPVELLKKLCVKMALFTKNRVWFDVRDDLF